MEKRDTITEIFGANVFNDEAMQGIFTEGCI